MLVKKGGIARDIDEKRLHEYTAKGYAPASAAKEDGGEKPIEKMGKDELIKNAAKEPDQKDTKKPARGPDQK